MPLRSLGKGKSTIHSKSPKGANPIKSGSHVFGVEVKSGGQVTGKGIGASRAQFKGARRV
jgi:hypothetical protein